MKKKSLLIVICIALCVQGVFANEPFNWHLALVKDGNGLQFNETEPVVMKNGDNFIINLYSERDFYVYIIVKQANGEWLPYFNQRISANIVKKIPCTLDDDSGQEEFYLITSSTEQRRLQTAIENFKRNKSVQNATILEARLLEVNDPTSNNPGKPTYLGGSIRSGDGTVPVQATAYSGATVYSKTITIKH